MEDEEDEEDDGIVSCTSIGFVFTVFALSVSLLNCCLSMYFRITIVKGISEEFVVQRYEKVWYFVSIIVPMVAFGIAGIITQSYNPNSYSNICSFQTKDGDQDEIFDSSDDNKDNVGLKFGYIWVGVLFVSSIIGFGSTYEVYRAVRDRARAMARYAFRGGRTTTFSNTHSSTHAAGTTGGGGGGGAISNHSGSDDHRHTDNSNRSDQAGSDGGSVVIASNNEGDPTFIPVSEPPPKLMQRGLGRPGKRVSRLILLSLNKVHSSVLRNSSILTNRSPSFSLGGVAAERVKAVATQAIVYSLAYLNSIFWPVMVAIVSSGALSRANGVWYAMDLMAWTFYPLQGFWNCLVYLRPTWVQWRKMYPSKSRIWVFSHIMELDRDDDDDENETNNAASTRTNTSRISSTRKPTGVDASNPSDGEADASPENDEALMEEDEEEGYSSEGSGGTSTAGGSFHEEEPNLEVVQEEEGSSQEEDEEVLNVQASDDDEIPLSPVPTNSSSRSVEMDTVMNYDVAEEVVPEEEDIGAFDKSMSVSTLIHHSPLRSNQMSSSARVSSKSTRTSISVEELLEGDSSHRRSDNSSRRRHRMHGSSMSSSTSGSSHRSRRSGRRLGASTTSKSSLHASVRASQSQLRGSSLRGSNMHSTASSARDFPRSSIYVDDLQHRRSTRMRPSTQSQESFMCRSSLSVSAFFDLDLEPDSQRSSSSSASYRHHQSGNSSKMHESSSSSSRASSRRSARPMVRPESPPDVESPSDNNNAPASPTSGRRSHSLRNAWSSFWNHSVVMTGDQRPNLDHEEENDGEKERELKTESTNEDELQTQKRLSNTSIQSIPEEDAQEDYVDKEKNNDDDDVVVEC